MRDTFVILLAMVFGIAFVLSKDWIYSSISAMDNVAVEFVVKIMLILFDGTKDIIAIFYLLIYLLY